MNIKDLKIGDKVKVKKHGNRFRWDEYMIVEYIGDSYITATKIPDKFVYSSFDVEKKYIISKLEPLSQEIKYKEIPIEKEPEYYKKCKENPKPTNESKVSYIPPDNNLPPPPYPGKKSAPKSFKFDISFVNRVEFNQLPYCPGIWPECFFSIEGRKITYHPNNPDINLFNGEEYTIEIKEKE